MASSEANEQGDNPPNARSSPEPDIQEPVIIGSNRFLDIGPYASNAYYDDPGKWGSVFPWEFPQDATREQEEEFIDNWFGKSEVHKQGGRRPEGAGYRFLKQVWYTNAIYNIEHRVPDIATWWWEDEENKDFVTTVEWLDWICHPEAKPTTLFTAEIMKEYPEKLLYWTMRHIQELAAARKAEILAASVGEDTTEKSSTAAHETAITAEGPAVEAVSQPADAIDATTSSEVQPGEPQALDFMVTADVHPETTEVQQSTETSVEQPTDNSLDEKVEAAISASQEQDVALPSNESQEKTTPPRDEALEDAVEQASDQSMEKTAEQSSNKPEVSTVQPSNETTGVQSPTTPATNAESRTTVAETRPPDHTPLRVSNTIFVPRMPPQNPAPAEGASQAPVYQAPSQRGHEQHNFGISHGAQPALPDYGSQRGKRGGQRGSSSRRMSRGGRENPPRGRIGSNTFESPQHAMEHHHALPPPPFYGDPNMHPSRQGMFPPNMPMPYYAPQPYQHHPAHNFGWSPPHPPHGEQPYFPPNVGPPLASHASAATPAQPNTSNTTDPQANVATKSFIGSNRHEVNQLVIFQSPPDMTEEQLQQLFANIGLTGVQVGLRRKPGHYNHQYVMAFARFRTHDDARRGLTLNGFNVGNRSLVVEVSKEFWDHTHSRYQTRYLGPPQQHHSAVEGPYGSDANNRRGVSQPLDSQHQVVQEPDRNFSLSSEGIARVLPTQDARFMDLPPRVDSTVSEVPPAAGTNKEGGAKKQKNKNKKKNQQASGRGPESDLSKEIKDKTNEHTESSSPAIQDDDIEVGATKSAAKHTSTRKAHTDEAKNVFTKSIPQIEKQKPDTSANVSPVPTGDAEKALKVAKRADATAAEKQKDAARVAVTTTKEDHSKAADSTITTAELSKVLEAAVVEEEHNKLSDAVVTQDQHAKLSGVDSTKEDHPRDTASKEDQLSKRPGETSARSKRPAGLEKEEQDDAVTDTDSKVIDAAAGTVSQGGAPFAPKGSVSIKEPAASKQAMRVATPMRVASSKSNVADHSTATTPTTAVTKKPQSVATTAREVSASSVPSPPASVYTTAPPTPTVGESQREEKKEKGQERSKGPSQTESLSMFGKKQSKPKKKDTKGKGTLKGKPKELAEAATASKEKPKELVEGTITSTEKAVEDSKTAKTSPENANEPVDALARLDTSKPPDVALTTAPKKTKSSKSKSKANKAGTATAPVPVPATVDGQTVESSAASPVTSPSKLKNGLNSLFGLLTRQNSSTAVTEQQTTEPVAAQQNGPAKPTDPADEEPQGSVSLDAEHDVTESTVRGTDIDPPAAEVCKERSECSDLADSAILKSTSEEEASVEKAASIVDGLGLSGVPALDESTGDTMEVDRKPRAKQRLSSQSSSESNARVATPASSEQGYEGLPTSNATPQPTFERDKDVHSASSRTLSAHGTPTTRSPTPRLPIRPTRNEHLIEAPQPRNAHKRRAHRPQSTSGPEAGSVLNSESVIAANSSDNSSDDSSTQVVQQKLTLYKVDSQPDVYVPADDGGNTLYIIYPPSKNTSPHIQQAFQAQAPSTGDSQSSAITPFPAAPNTAPEEGSSGALTQLYVLASSSLTGEPEAKRLRKDEIQDSEEDSDDLDELGQESDAGVKNDDAV